MLDGNSTARLRQTGRIGDSERAAERRRTTILARRSSLGVGWSTDTPRPSPAISCRAAAICLPPKSVYSRWKPEVQVLCHCHWQPQRATAMTLIIVHGLEGSSESQYVIGTGSKAWRAGMNVVRMNMRNCGGSEGLGPTLYNSSMSADVGAVAKTLIAQDGLQKLAFAGFSMGGNMVLKMLGEWGERLRRRVKAGGGHFAGDGPGSIGRRAARCRQPHLRMEISPRPAPPHSAQSRALSRPCTTCAICVESAQPARLRRPDHRALLRFSDAQDYYLRAASSRVLDPIAVPTLVIHAKDDPFIRILPETRGEAAPQSEHHLCRDRAWRPLCVSGRRQRLRRPLGRAPDDCLPPAGGLTLNRAG